MKILIVACALVALAPAGFASSDPLCSYEIADQLYSQLVWKRGDTPMPLHRWRVLLGPDEWLRGRPDIREAAEEPRVEIIRSPYEYLRKVFRREAEDLDENTFRMPFGAGVVSILISRELSPAEREVSELGLTTVPHREHMIAVAHLSDGTSQALAPIVGHETQVIFRTDLYAEFDPFIRGGRLRGAHLTRLQHIHNHSFEPMRHRRRSPLNGWRIAFPSVADTQSLGTLAGWFEMVRTLPLKEFENLTPAEAGVFNKLRQWDFSGGVSLENTVVVGTDPGRLVAFRIVHEMLP